MMYNCKTIKISSGNNLVYTGIKNIIRGYYDNFLKFVDLLRTNRRKSFINIEDFIQIH